MVDRTNLERISNLYAELRTIDAALENFGNGGFIMNMTISGGPPGSPTPGFGPPRMPVTVSTASMQTPPQMLDSIKAQYSARVAAIGQELSELGVTGG
jgi:hypothetical protein